MYTVMAVTTVSYKWILDHSVLAVLEGTTRCERSGMRIAVVEGTAAARSDGDGGGGGGGGGCHFPELIS